MNTKFSKLALAIGALVMAGGAMAADSGSGTMGISASIVDECSVGNTVALAFGNLAMLTAGAQSATASASTSGGTFDAICTNNTLNTPKLRFSSANTGTSDFRMVGTDTTSYIVYTLATAADAAIVYGTDAAFAGFTADGTVKSLTIKGSIAASEKGAKKVQAYSDIITIQSSYNL
ncbi:MAG: spore coat protein U domain-containing protein [Burkholderiales bacterium]|nr:spore coat protein U domain-containing protein [Burkholderiales bacterium]